MILTCPQCATRYFVEADKLGPEGRQVRCSSCASSWKAEPVVVAAEAEEAPLDLTARSDVVEVGREALRRASTEAPHQTLREQTVSRRRTREAMTAGATWAVLAAGFALVILAAVVFRVQVVRLAPATAGAYAFARMPVNPTGFLIDDVQGGPALANGRLATVVTGAQRNVQNAARVAPPLRVSLLDKGGRALASQVFMPPATKVAPGDARPFRVSFVDAPPAAQVQVEFAFDVRRAPPAEPVRHAPAHLAAPTPKSAPPAAAERTPAPLATPITAVEAAKPLPAGSRYALPTPAAPSHG